jgi:hypothetical protein
VLDFLQSTSLFHDTSPFSLHVSQIHTIISSNMAAIRNAEWGVYTVSIECGLFNCGVKVLNMIFLNWKVTKFFYRAKY